MTGAREVMGKRTSSQISRPVSIFSHKMYLNSDAAAT